MPDRLKKFFAPNLGVPGRIIRAIMAIIFLAGVWLAWPHSTILALVLLGCGIVGLYEALRGWCALRACGVKTRF
jgi:hypothetical protein